MSRADLLTLLAIASGYAPPCPYAKGADPFVPRPPTPDEWAAHLMAHAKALGRAVDAELYAAPEHAPGCVVTRSTTACEFDCPVRARRLG